eukprot:2182933-Prymnesium_polylepis.1
MLYANFRYRYPPHDPPARCAWRRESSGHAGGRVCLTPRRRRSTQSALILHRSGARSVELRHSSQRFGGRRKGTPTQTQFFSASHRSSSVPVLHAGRCAQREKWIVL